MSFTQRAQEMSLTCRAEEGREKGHLPGKLRKGRKKVIYKERNIKNMKIVFLGFCGKEYERSYSLKAEEWKKKGHLLWELVKLSEKIICYLLVPGGLRKEGKEV